MYMKHVAVIMGLLLLMSMVFAGAYSTNLVAYWKLDEASGLPQDSKGAFNGTGNNLITYDTTGKIGRDFNFAAGATKSFASFGTSTSLAAQTFSVCGWAWTNATAANAILSRKNSTATKDSFSLESDAGGSWYFIHHNTAGTQKYAVTSGAVSANAWHFFCGSRDTTSLYLWVDNVLYVGATSPYTGSVYQGTDVNFSMGANSDLSQLFNGRLDEVAYFDKNLSAADVNELWNGGAGLTYSPGVTPVPVKIDFNVYRAGTSTHLNYVTMDCNINTYDNINKQSQFSVTMMDMNVYDCNFSVPQGYDINNQKIVADVNKTVVIYLTDSNAPSTHAAGNSASWSTTPITITLTCTDLNGSGCAGTTYRHTNPVGGTPGAWLNYTIPVVMSTDRNSSFDYNSRDVAGNIETYKTINILIDATAPTVGLTTTASYTIVGSQIWGTGNIVGGVATDALSGIDTTSCQYTIDGVNWLGASWSADHCYKNGIAVTSGTTYVFNTRVKDNAGTYGTGTATTTYTGDNVAPTVGLTTITAFTTYLTWIKGTGNILGGMATDAVSGIKASSCEYTTNNGVSWASNTWNTDHCETIGFVINDGITYKFNTRMTDNALNLGTGTATGSYLGDTSGPTTTDNSVPTYSTSPTITLTANDGAGSGVKQTWYCVDLVNTCTPGSIGNSVVLTVPAGFIQTFYIRYLSTDNLDNNETVNSTGLITVDRATPVFYPDNNTNTQNWLSLTNLFSENLFGFDYTTLGIFMLILIAIAAFIFRINAVVAIILSIPLTYSFFLLAGGTDGVLLILLVVEIIALAVKIALSFFAIGSSGD